MSTRKTLNGGFEIDWQQRAIDAEKLVKWVADYFERTPGLERYANRDDAAHIMGKMHVVINAYQGVQKHVECSARVHHENVALQAAKQQAEQRLETEKIANRMLADDLNKAEQKVRALELERDMWKQKFETLQDDNLHDGMERNLLD